MRNDQSRTTEPSSHGPALATFDRRWSTASCAALKRSVGASVTVAIPALDEQSTIGAICGSVAQNLMRGHALVDELLVLDGGSNDSTAARASAAGARVVDVASVLRDVPLRAGNGESLWRSLAVIETDIVVWVDADIRNFEEHFVTNLVAPLLDEDVDFVKAYYTRPLQMADTLLPHGGGRVTELLAKPLLAEFFPELTAFHQPLAGEYAARTDVMRDLPFFTGYSVEVGLLIDLFARDGLARMAQADLGTRVHRNRPLSELAPMAHQLAHTITRRAVSHGRISEPGSPSEGFTPWDGELERPAMSLVQRSPDLEADAMPRAAS